MVNKLELPVMWSVTLELMTNLEEEDIRHELGNKLGLPDSTSAMVGGEVDFNNLAYSCAEITIDCSKVLLADAT